MKNPISIRLFFLLLLSLPGLQRASAQVRGSEPPLEDGEIIYGFDEGKEATRKYGTGKKETYDVAIRIDDPKVAGLSVIGVRIPMKGTANINNMSAWLSSELKLEKSGDNDVNIPDITSKTVTPHDGYVEVRFDKPHAITEKGLFAGYSFDVATLDDDNARPVMLTDNPRDGGLFLHTSRTYRKWDDKSSSLKGNSAIQIIIAKVPDHAVELCPIAAVDVRTNTEITIPCRIINKGSKGMTSIDYRCEIDGKTYENRLPLPETGVRFGGTASFSLRIPPISAQNVCPLNLKVTKVNGEPNSDPANAASCDVNVYEKSARHRPVIEEYTGTWCGFCPRGMAGTEKMKRLFPEDFIAISYHCKDVMSIMTENRFPSPVEELPLAVVDRARSTDAYTGDETGNTFGIDKVWREQREVIAPAEVTVSASFDENVTQTIDVTARVTFILPQAKNHHKVEFVLLADSLHGEGKRWAQTNYYSGDGNWAVDEEMKRFVDAGDPVSGLYYNDVIIARADAGNDFPTSFNGGAVQEMTCRFDVTKCSNLNGESLIQGTRNLHVVALLVDTDNGIVKNADKTKVLIPADISVVTANDIQSVAYYDLSGRRLTKPVKGICIKAVTFDNGRTVYSKTTGR